MGKIAEIINKEQERAFDLVREPDALYLCVKCSDSKKHSKIVKIKLTDVLYQVWRKKSFLEKRKAVRCFTELAAADSKTA